jgi:hypothetical protein
MEAAHWVHRDPALLLITAIFTTSALRKLVKFLSLPLKLSLREQ